MNEYFCNALTGGADRALDSLKINTPLATGQAAALADGDRAFVITSGYKLIIFEYQASETDAENTDSRPYRVRPDDYISQGVWYEVTPFKDAPLQNLLTNSGFGVWSNSDGPHNYGSAIAEDDCADDDTGDWTVGANATLTFDTDHYEIATNGAANQSVDIRSLTVEEGHIYKVTAQVKDGTETSEPFKLKFYDGSTAFEKTFTTTGSFTEVSAIFKATNDYSNANFGFKIPADMVGDNIEFKNFSVYEVTPGCTGANSLACDGWNKSSSLSVYREPNGDNTFTGSYYSAKIVKGSDSAEYLYIEHNIPALVDKEKERVISFALKAKDTNANNTRVYISDGVGSSFSSYHTGGGEEEWLEATRKIDSSATQIVFGVIFNADSADITYLGCPIAIYGVSIGEGNYQAPPGEIINLEAPFNLTDWDGTAKSTSADEEINLEAQSEGKLPGGLKAVNTQIKANDSGSASNACSLGIGADVSVAEELKLDIGSAGLVLANDNAAYASGRVNCNYDDNIEAEIVASGTDTLDATIKILSVELR